MPNSNSNHLYLQGLSEGKEVALQFIAYQEHLHKNKHRLRELASSRLKAVRETQMDSPLSGPWLEGYCYSMAKILSQYLIDLKGN